MNNNGKFFDGLLWGVLIGGAAVFLLGTEKGKKVLKTITEEGMEGLNEVIEDFEDNLADLGEEVKPQASEEPDNIVSHPDELQSHHRGKIKRFFRSKKPSD